MLLQYPHPMTYAPAKFKAATPKSLGEYAFTRKYIIWPGVKFTRNIAQYPLHHVTYTPA